MARFASNVRISSPITIGAQPDVDFNGFMFSYVVGLMFPPGAAKVNTPMQLPSVPAASSVGALGRSRQ